ncbi:MAG: protein kinase domain-containing protein [Microcoleaceae cyanobacterium]
MSYCVNPNCQIPQNFGETDICANCGTPLLLIPPDRVPSEYRYRVIKPIGQGGFGRTFLAINETQTTGNSFCVIKQFFPQGAIVPQTAKIFAEEAQRLEVLGKHPQIPTLFNYFCQDNYQYLVQEFIDGENIEQELTKLGTFNETKIRELLKELLAILHFVHKNKVIHRDIKPSNIIRRRSPLPPLIRGDQDTSSLDLIRGTQNISSSLQGGGEMGIFLVDFGAAKLVKTTIPQTGTIIGSAAYTAPEQLMGKAIFASDIYSLGVTCIYLLTQIPPFDLFDHQEGRWAWRDYLKSPVSDDLGRIIDRMIQNATNRRYHSVAAILRDLDPNPVYIHSINPVFSPEKTEENVITIFLDNESKEEEVTRIILDNEESEKDSSLGEVVENSHETSVQKTLEKYLQKYLNYYLVKIQVTLVKKQLTIVINRSENHQVNYPKLAEIITAKLTELKMSNQVTQVKILGRIKNQQVPEWKKVLFTKNKVQSGSIIAQGNQVILEKMRPALTRQFWLTQIHEKNFWMDALMGAMTIYIFSSTLVVFHPFLSLIIATMFILVKRLIADPQELNVNKLFTTLLMIFILSGFLNIHFVINPTFHLILACLFIALPLFHIPNK